MADEIVRPLSVVDELFRRHIASGNGPSSEWGEKQHFVQSLGLDDEECFAKIPCLNDVELAESMPPFSLVRYRCLVQDVFEPEIYSALVQEQDGNSGAVRPLTTKYRECIEPAPGNTLVDLGPEGYSQRGACYCVPLPGETRWARAAAVAWTHAGGGSLPTAPSAAPSRGPKRSRPDGADDAMGGQGSEAPPPPAPVGEARRPRLAASGLGTNAKVGNAESLQTAEDFGLNFPIKSEESRGRGSSTACIVKLYDSDAEILKLCDAVEIVGVLCVNPEVASFNELEQSGLWDARNPSTSFVPRLHAVLIRRLPHHHPLVPYTSSFLTEARLASAFQRNLSAPGLLMACREKALVALTVHLAGDVVAAQYVLMHLVSRSFASHGDQLLGAWSLNLGCWPEGLSVKNFTDAISEFVPRAVHLEVTAEALNTGKWRPVKDFIANRLVAGQLQLAAGTLVMLDETNMAEGKLVHEGVKNLNAIRTLVADHELTCDFTYDVKIPLEVQTINLSRRKSIISDVDVLVPLRAGTAGVASMPAEALDAVRLLIALVTRNPQCARIPEPVTQKFSEDYAAARERWTINPGICNAWMSLARAYCLTTGDNELTMERWAKVLELEHERLRRCKEENFLSP